MSYASCTDVVAAAQRDEHAGEKEQRRGDRLHDQRDMRRAIARVQPRERGGQHRVDAGGKRHARGARDPRVRAADGADRQ